MNTRCFGQSLPVLDCPASGQPGFSHIACMLWIADAVTACNTYRYLLKHFTWGGNCCYELQCLVFVCTGTCVWIHMKNKGITSAVILQMNYFLLLFCACVWYVHVCVFPVWVGQPTHCLAVFCSSSSVWLLVAPQLRIPAALLLLSLYCLCHCFTVCCFSHFQLSLKRQKKNCLRKAFFEYNITAKLACLYNREGVFVPVIANLLCKWRFVFALVSSVPFPPITQFPLVGH